MTVENNTIRLLVIEDSPADFRILKEMLRDMEEPYYKVTRAERFAEAVDLLQSNNFDAIILDLDLADSTGLKTLDKLEQRSHGAPLIIMTGMNDEHLGVEAIRNGAADYLVKGKVDANLLSRSIRYAIERKRSEDKLQESGERLNALYMSMSEGLAYHEILYEEGKAVDYIMVDVNPAYEKITGFSHEKVRGIKASELYGTGHPPYLDIYARVAAGEGSENFEVHFQPLDKYFAISAFSPAKGKFATVFSDITERKRIQEVLRRSNIELEKRVKERTEALALSEERFRLALTNGSIMVAHVDKQLRYTWIYNPLPGLELSKLIYKRDDEIWQGKEILRFKMFKQNVLETGKGGRIEIELPFQDEIRSFDVLIEPLRSDKGELTGLTMAALDITERRNLEVQLLQSQKMEAIGRLAGGIAHDFNNMMQVVTGYAQIALRELPPDDPLVRYIDRMKEAGESAGALTQQLLAFSRKQILQFYVLDLNSVVVNIEDMLRRTLGEEIVLETKFEKDLPYIKGDPTRLQQVVMNLALNAKDAMEDGGTLILETSEVALGEEHPFGERALPAGNYVMLSVTDTGCGMDKEIQTKIFEPFFTTKPKDRGTGLGLSMVYGTVKQSGGIIRIYSEVGKGTTFKIYFPITNEPLSTFDNPQIGTASYGSETLLIVEDNKKVRELAVQELSFLGYHVLDAGDEIEAQNISDNHNGPIHLLITDVILPGKNGKEVSDALAKKRLNLKTLFISGHAEGQIVERGILIPGTNFLAKPFTLSHLAAKIREVLRDVTKNIVSVACTGRVLVVDDVTGVADSIAYILKKEGYETKTAVDGTSAIKLTESMKPNVVLLDLSLPDISGYEVAKHIRQLNLNPAPFIIATSGYSLEEREESSEVSYFDEYLVKPIDFKKLRSLLASQLAFKA